MSSVQPRHVFICGNARGGTTLLARLLDGHPSCMVLPSDTCVRDFLMDRPLAHAVIRASHLLDRYELTEWLAAPWTTSLAFGGRATLEARLMRWLEDFAGPESADAVAAAADVAARIRLPEGYWEAFFEVLAYLEGAGSPDRPLRVEKTPLNEALVPLLDRLFGVETRYLHIVRDPRAVVASWLATRSLTGAARREAILARCVDWARSVDRCRYHLRVRRGRYLALRYEDLVAAPEKVMAGVFGFLSLVPHETSTVATSLGVPVARNTSFPGARRPGEVSRAGAGDVPDVLEAPERGRIERWLGAHMKACGYHATDSRDGASPGRRREDGSRRVRGAMKRAELSRRRKAVQGERIDWAVPVISRTGPW